MKINIAVWTAVNGYAWQPGSVYSPDELVRYKNEIGQLDANNLPFGGLFLKDGKAVFWRTQIAPRMDSCGRGAVYCVVGAVPEDMAAKVDFHAVFASSEVSKPQKPFPASLELPERTGEFKSPLGNADFAERRFNGSETFAELGGWCEEAKGGRLNVRITGSLDTPLFIVAYKPRAVPPSPPPRPVDVGARQEIPSRPCPAERADVAASRPRSIAAQPERRCSDLWTSEPPPANWGRTPPDVGEVRARTSADPFWNSFACLACGFAFGVIVTAAVCFWAFKLKVPCGLPPAAQDSVVAPTPSSPEKETIWKEPDKPAAIAAPANLPDEKDCSAEGENTIEVPAASSDAQNYDGKKAGKQSVQTESQKNAPAAS